STWPSRRSWRSSGPASRRRRRPTRASTAGTSCENRFITRYNRRREASGALRRRRTARVCRVRHRGLVDRPVARPGRARHSPVAARAGPGRPEGDHPEGQAPRGPQNSRQGAPRRRTEGRGPHKRAAARAVSITGRLRGRSQQRMYLPSGAGDPWAIPSNGSLAAWTPAGVPVTEDTAMQLLVVAASVLILANAVAGLPLDAVRMTGTTRKQLDPAPAIIADPFGGLNNLKWPTRRTG